MDALAPASELRALLSGGDLRRAGEWLVVHYAADVVSLCRSMVRERELAEDLAQDVFSSAFAHLRGYRAEASPRTWLLSIARNRCIDHLRREEREPFDLGEEGDEPEAFADDAPLPADLLSRRSDVEAALGLLAETERALVVLRFRHGLEYPELSTVFGLREGTVRMRLSRALAKMRQELEARELAFGAPPPPPPAMQRGAPPPLPAATPAPADLFEQEEEELTPTGRAAPAPSPRAAPPALGAPPPPPRPAAAIPPRPAAGIPPRPGAPIPPSPARPAAMGPPAAARASAPGTPPPPPPSPRAMGAPPPPPPPAGGAGVPPAEVGLLSRARRWLAGEPRAGEPLAGGTRVGGPQGVPTAPHELGLALTPIEPEVSETLRAKLWRMLAQLPGG